MSFLWQLNLHSTPRDVLALAPYLSNLGDAIPHLRRCLAALPDDTPLAALLAPIDGDDPGQALPNWNSRVTAIWHSRRRRRGCRSRSAIGLTALPAALAPTVEGNSRSRPRGRVLGRCLRLLAPQIRRGASGHLGLQRRAAVHLLKRFCIRFFGTLRICFAASAGTASSDGGAFGCGPPGPPRAISS